MTSSALLTYVRSTKGMCRYIEGDVVIDPETKEKKEVLVDQPLIGVLYISKARLSAKPRQVQVTLEEVVDATD